MRFLNTYTLQFEEVADSELHFDENQYAILSHRWGRDEDEVSYEDMVSGRDVSKKKGFAKIKGFCDLVSPQCRYGWVDTCCINKANSSELAEAINSMYLWYSNSKMCVVYLEDVPRKEMMDSEWFNRGWTLQELIAPKELYFFDHDWKGLGSKYFLIEELERKTMIPGGVLDNTKHPSTCSVAQRMSWAAKRTTKRIEDRAYSLLGLFGVNMPMLYGEREKAFVRLQQHIVQKSKDESLFSWVMEPPGPATPTHSGIYAPSPSAFLECDRVKQKPGSKGFSEMNGELDITLPVAAHSPGLYTALLHCTDASEYSVYIVIARTQDGTYVRVRDLNNVSQGMTALVKDHHEQNLRFTIDPPRPPTTIFFGFWLRTLEPPGFSESEITTWSNQTPPEEGYICQLNREQRVTGVVHIKPKNNPGLDAWSQIRWIMFGFDSHFNPVLWLANDSQSEKIRGPFERALASQHSELQSQNDSYWDECIPPDLVCGPGRPYFECQDLKYEWPHGRAIIRVDRDTGLQDFIISKLEVQISVRLQPIWSPSATRFTNRHNLSMLRATHIWVVDITTTNARPKTVPLPDMNFRWRHWLADLICCPLLAIGTDCAGAKEPCAYEIGYNCGPSCYDVFYPWCKERWMEREIKRVRAAYESDASFRVPVLVSQKPQREAYPSARIRPMTNGWCF